MRMSFITRSVALLAALALVACSSGPSKPEPTPLTAITPGVSVAAVWQAQVGPGSALLRIGASGERIAVASVNGEVQVRQAASGELSWNLRLPQAIVTGVGFDGQRVAVVDETNALVVVRDGQEAWRYPLQARTYTPPLVAGDRVFVLDAQRQVRAFDADNGAPLWSAPYTGEALVLQAPGLLSAYGNSLLVGWGERLVGLQPDTGKPFWSAAITLPRGVNEIERLTDVVAGAHAARGLLCARAFQAAVSCVDTQSGQRRWSQDSDGASGVIGDEDLVIGADRSGRIQAWALADGSPQWTQDDLRYRDLSAPTLLGLSFAIGDAQGHVHWLSKSTGRILNRLPTDGTAVAAPPVLAAGTLVVQTLGGGLFAWQPQ